MINVLENARRSSRSSARPFHVPSVIPLPLSSSPPPSPSPRAVLSQHQPTLSSGRNVLGILAQPSASSIQHRYLRASSINHRFKTYIKVPAVLFTLIFFETSSHPPHHTPSIPTTPLPATPLSPNTFLPPPQSIRETRRYISF